MQGGSSLNFCSFKGGAFNFKKLGKKKFPSPPSINNDRSLNLLYDTYYIKTYFIALKQVKLGCWLTLVPEVYFY
jgi:hypothetical protein